MQTSTPGLSRLTLFVVAAAVLLGCNLFSPAGFNTNNPPLNVPQSGSTANVQLGRIVTSTGVDQNSCPVDSQTVFAGNQSIYVAAELLYAPSGVTLMARWSHNGQPFEDTPAITTDRTYQNQCLEFHINSDQTLSPGQYSVAILVNGQPARSANFQVQ